MNRLLCYITLSALGLISLASQPAFAQLGPAGVPGISELFADQKPANKPVAATPNPPRTAPPKVKPAKPQDCSNSKEPAYCERMKQAKAQCKDKLDTAHRQCLHNILVPNK